MELILRDYPYPDYNSHEFNIDEIFKRENNEIRKFIRILRVKYTPNRFQPRNANNNRQQEYELVQQICSHLNNIYSYF